MADTMSPIDSSKAISLLAPGCAYHADGDEILEWLTPDISQPSEEDIQAKMDELEAEYEANQYQRDRKPEYPSITDQMDMQYHDAVDGTTTWQEAVQAVKDAHPKPE